MAAASSCQAHGNQDKVAALPSGTTSFVVRLSGGGLEESFVEHVATQDSGIYVLPGIPPAAGATLEIVTCSGNEARWAGVTRHVDIQEHTKTFPTVFLSPIGEQPACVNEGPGVGHAFGGAVRLDDDVFILGGLDSYSLAGGSTGKGEAGRSISHYQRLTGELSTLDDNARLLEPRAMATVYARADGTVRLIGGAGKVHLNASFDLWTPGSSAPSCGVETYNPLTGAAICTIDGALPAGGSGAYLGDDVSVYVGGVDPDTDAPSDALFIIDGATATQLTMPSARFGASVVALSATQALVWGGNTDGDVDQLGLLVDVFTLEVNQLTITGTPADVPIWAAASYAGTNDAGQHRVLIAGGTELLSANGVASASIPPQGPRLHRLSVEGTTVSVESIALGEQAPLFKRVGATLTRAPSGEYWLLGGMTSFVTDLDVCPSASSGACFPDSMARFSVDDSGTLALNPQKMSGLGVGPLGAVAIDLGDESSLVLGGLMSASQGALDVLGAEVVRYESSASSLCATN